MLYFVFNVCTSVCACVYVLKCMHLRACGRTSVHSHRCWKVSAAVEMQKRGRVYSLIEILIKSTTLHWPSSGKLKILTSNLLRSGRGERWGGKGEGERKGGEGEGRESKGRRGEERVVGREGKEDGVHGVCKM